MLGGTIVTLEKRDLYGGEPALVLKWVRLAMLMSVFDIKVVRISCNWTSSRRYESER